MNNIFWLVLLLFMIILFWRRKQIFNSKNKNRGQIKIQADGIVLSLPQTKTDIKWVQITKLTAYKVDLIATDEISLDIYYKGMSVTINEEMEGWDEFVNMSKSIFPAIPQNWELEIVKPAFATNLTILYEKE